MLTPEEQVAAVREALSQIEARFDIDALDPTDVARDNAYRYAVRTIRAALATEPTP
jgi:hypothetical protein